MSRNAVGRAFRITEKDARSYDRVSKPRSKMRANPMGVTTLASVNGRGAYASARAAAHGQTRAQRLARARKLIGGKGMQSNARGHRAAFISAMRSNKKSAPAAPGARTRGKRLAAYKSALARGMSKDSARRSAVRKVPFTANERKAGHVFAGKKAPKKTARKKATKYRSNRNTVAEQKRYESGWEGTFGKKAGAKKRRKTTGKGKKVATPKTKRKSTKRKSTGRKRTAKRKTAKRKSPTQYRTVKSTVKRKRRVAYGKYKRAKLYNPRTGRTEYSYMYRTKAGRLRRIPTSAVAGLHERGKKSGERATKMAAKVRKARERAAARILKEGGVFVPNRRKTKKTKTKRKSAKRVAAGKKAARTRKRRAAAKSAKRKTSRKTKRRSTKRRSAKRKTTGRKSAKRVAAGKKAARTRKRNASKGRKTTSKRKTRRSSKRKGRRLKKGTYYVANRRRARSKRRRSSGKRMRKNAFMANLTAVLKTGALVAVGYMSHRVLSSLLDQYVFTPYVQAPEGKEPNMALKPWSKPICGAVVGLAGVGALSVMTDKRIMSGQTAMSIGGGMIASLVQYVVVGALTAFDQPVAAGYLNGYSNSMAYSLRGNRRRRAMRGIGASQSIMPRYQPISGYQQAAAGVGEYFVPKGTQGVGQYEPAGPLAMQAAAGFGQIEDGIRPDSNLDQVLDLAESAAGLGEYITATPGGGGWDESRVPTQSQWIPNGPLWAGEMRVKDNMATSELPAGVLATPGGNGILSG